MFLNFHPVVSLPPDYLVFDFTQGPDPRAGTGVWGIGRYKEVRKNIYQSEIFKTPDGERNIHMGVDIGGPAGTPIYAFGPGEICSVTYHEEPGDYGWTLITKHKVEGLFSSKNESFFVLWGHLSKKSVENKTVGQKFKAGELVAEMGSFSENGGWPPHLHFQISLVEPSNSDMPGVVTAAQLPEAEKTYPDPRIVLGYLY